MNGNENIYKMNEKNKKNIYYVDEECIACDACVLIADKHFKIDEEKALAYVCRQPQNQKEHDLCQEAMETCPVEAIHNDGPQTQNN